MPRSKSDRNFGFKSKGLIRILTSADIDEVQEALLAIGFSTLGTGVGAAIKKLIKAPFELLGGLLDLVFEDVIPLVEDLRSQIDLLDITIENLVFIDNRVTGPSPRRLPAREWSADALEAARKLRRELAAAILRAEANRLSIQEVSDESKALEETQETSLNNLLDESVVV